MARICSLSRKEGEGWGRGAHRIEFNEVSMLSPPVLKGRGEAAGGKLKATEFV